MRSGRRKQTTAGPYPPGTAGGRPGKNRASLSGRPERLDNIYSLLVVRNGFLVAEKYFNGQDMSRANPTASVTKSFISALAGIALRENALDSLDQRLTDFFPEIDWQNADPRKSQITIRQVLQMRSGYPWEEADGYLTTLFSRSNWIPLLEEFPLMADPGARFGYSNFMAHMMAVILSRADGQAPCSPLPRSSSSGRWRSRSASGPPTDSGTTMEPATSNSPPGPWPASANSTWTGDSSTAGRSSRPSGSTPPSRSIRPRPTAARS